MKTNLDTLFKTDKVSEKEGVWFRVSDDVRFLVARFGNNAVKQTIWPNTTIKTN